MWGSVCGACASQHRQCPGCFSRCIAQMGPPGTDNSQNRSGKVGYELSTNCHYTAQFAVKIVPSLMLNMTSQELPHPNPNGYQQIIKWCICGAKGLVLVVLRPANGSRAGGVDRFDDQKPRFIRAHNRSNHQPSGTCRRTLGFRSRSQSCGPLVQL